MALMRAAEQSAATHDLSSLRKCVSAGEALPAATRTLWQQATGLTLIDGIGSTELFHIFISAREDDARGGATGYVVPGYTAAILDEIAAHARAHPEWLALSAPL
jgi:2-aminobenzoate-CoA ligase